MSKWTRRIIFSVLGLIVLLVVFVVGSIAVDAAIGRGRLDPLTNTSIPNTGGPPVRAFVARPATPGPHPSVIMVHEWWGLQQEIVGKAEALAEQGYVVVAPDTFRGSTTGWIPRAIYQVSTTPTEQINGDLDAVFAWLASQPDVQADRIGIMGFCYGGRASLYYSLHNPEVAATVTLYGMGPTDAAQLQALQAPVLGIFGGADSSIPLEDVRALEAGLNQAGVPNTISVYDGQPHAFVKSIAEIRQGGPQQQAWNEILGFFAQTLQQGQGWRSNNTLLAHTSALQHVTITGMLHHRIVCAVKDL